ncbi:ABC transporter substrate-binding protein [Microbacterium sp. F1-18]
MHVPKRLIAGIAAGAAALVALSGCGVGNRAASTELSDGPVTLRMAWWGGDSRHERTQQVIDLFEAKYPNITIVPEFSDWSGYWEKLATATAGKNAADVIQMDELYLSSYAARGALSDLDALRIDTAGLDDSVLRMGRYDERLYAIPISTSSTALLVNTDLLDSIGVPLPDHTQSWTWDEFDTWAQTVTDAAPAGVYGTSVLSGSWQLQLFARQVGERLYDGDEVAVSAETVADFFRTSLDLTRSGASAPASVWSETSSLPLDQLPFSVGTAASFFAPATLISAYAKASGANIELVPMPNHDDGEPTFDYFKPGMYWSISSQSRHPAEAAALVDFLLNDPEATKIIGSERGLPASTRNLDLIKPGLTSEEAEAVAYSESRVPVLGAAPAPPPLGTSDVDAIFLRYLQEVMFERTTPETAATGFIADVQASIDAAN